MACWARRNARVASALLGVVATALLAATLLGPGIIEDKLQKGVRKPNRLAKAGCDDVCVPAAASSTPMSQGWAVV